MKTAISILFVLLFAGFQTACNRQKPTTVLFEAEGYRFPYQMQKPEKVIDLPDELNEISGLGFYKKNKLAGVQDEKGMIYIIDVARQQVVRKIKFAKKGDYEGIEIIDHTAWVLESNGTLYRVKDFEDEDKINVKKYKTALSKRNNAEGLGFSKQENRLLIACKGYPFLKNKKGKHKKAVYGFDVQEKELIEKPLFTIRLDAIKKHIGYSRMAQTGDELLSFLDPAEGDVSFQPSGIAIHPQSGNIYLLASVGKLLVVLNNDGAILAVIQLDKTDFGQPEGICFDDKGILFISNEGRSGKATLLKFSER